jgi:hypothetical protein
VDSADDFGVEVVQCAGWVGRRIVFFRSHLLNTGGKNPPRPRPRSPPRNQKKREDEDEDEKEEDKRELVLTTSFTKTARCLGSRVQYSSTNQQWRGGSATGF